MNAQDRSTGHVFLSYVREDSDRVDHLQDLLEAGGIRVWRDKAALWPGEDWRSRIRQAIIGNALVFIACFSAQSVGRDKSFQNEELTLAVEQLRLRRPDDPWLIPVRFDDCRVPDRDLGGGRTLESLHYIDLFGREADQNAAHLVDAVHRILRQDEGKKAISRFGRVSWKRWIATMTGILLVAGAVWGSAPLWWKYPDPQSAGQTAGHAKTKLKTVAKKKHEHHGPGDDGIVGMSGGCPAFQVFAQNRWAPYGTSVRRQPNILSGWVRGFPGNMSLAVNGWVYSRAAYPTNSAPFNSSVWFHLADNSGWVSFAGVRATPTSHDPSGVAAGGEPAPTPHACEGAIR